MNFSLTQMNLRSVLLKFEMHYWRYDNIDCSLMKGKRCNSIHSHNTRTSKNLHLPKTNTYWGKQKPTYQASKDFNNLDNTIKNADSLPKIQDFSKETNCKKLHWKNVVSYRIVSLLYCT